jgi:hypothetical protein
MEIILHSQVGPFNRALRADNTEGMNICMMQYLGDGDESRAL